MAKTLRSPTPSSSIVRLLDLGAAARATAAQPVEPTASSFAAPVPERPFADAVRPTMLAAPRSSTVDREVVLTPETDAVLSNLVLLCRTTTETKVTTSHVVRALLRVVAHRSGELNHRLRQLGKLKLPSNAAEFEADRARFEARLADAFLAALSGAED